MFEIWVTSTSSIKIAAIREIFSQSSTQFRIVPHQVNCANPNQPINSTLNCANPNQPINSTLNCANPNQPINSTLDCATNRLAGIRWDSTNPPGLVISIENGLEVTETLCHSVCYAVLLDPTTNQSVHGQSDPIPLDRKYYDQAVAESTPSSLGLNVTVGQMIHREFPDITAENWSAHPRFGGYDRKEQIKQALQRALDQLK
jgi:non-canonical (house-cleaning) NTP pyrophosphatase